NPDGARFCEECGMALAGRCLACGAEVTLNRPFCRACGAALDLPRAEARLDESERKQVTVLFADVKDSMAMLANRDPEEVRTILAARMEQMATPGSILATAATVGLARGVIDVVSLGPVAVKGLGTRVELYEVIGTARPSDAPPSHPWNPFVGREVELALLGRALAQADQGHGQIVGVVGDPGVGKTRLCREFIHSLRSDDWLIVRTVAASHGKSTAYLPLIDL